MIAVFITLALSFFTFFYGNSLVYAEEKILCDNRYLTLVNPVRGRDLWVDKTLKPLSDQYRLVLENNFSATWLLQYDVLPDRELLQVVKEFNDKQEVGVFLEVSQNLADNAQVIYPENTPWFNPKAVFLSGFSQSDRRRLIDKVFDDFKKEFGFYPRSVGAWWIDSYSLNYLREKYKVEAAMIVADQKLTDSYAVWGQWWGVAYYPSKANILVPASDLKGKQNVVITQWAQRDSLAAYGEKSIQSNYSLQANDYLKMGKDINYFKYLTGVYLGCQNKVGQITVGLETGMESVGFLGEYKKQLEYLKENEYLQSVTMSQFAKSYSRIYPNLPDSVILSFFDSKWTLTRNSRQNEKNLNSIEQDPEFKLINTNYNRNLAFSDYFLADESTFLDRKLPDVSQRRADPAWPLFLLMIVGTGIVAYLKKIFPLYLAATLFILAAYGPILRSGPIYGWQVLYGPNLPNLSLIQPGLVLGSYALFFLLRYFKNLDINKGGFFWLFPLSFGFDLIFNSLKATSLSGSFHLGFFIEGARFVGLTFSRPLYIGLVSQDFTRAQMEAFLGFNYIKILEDIWFVLVIYPVFHILIAVFLASLLRRISRQIKVAVFAILIILFIFYLSTVFQTDPLFVAPIE